MTAILEDSRTPLPATSLASAQRTFVGDDRHIRQCSLDFKDLIKGGSIQTRRDDPIAKTPTHLRFLPAAIGHQIDAKPIPGLRQLATLVRAWHVPFRRIDFGELAILELIENR
jgi:hypothetical protein